MLRRLASFCYRRRWRVLIAWVVVLVGVNVLAQTVGGTLLKTFSLPGSESQKAFDALGRNFAVKGDTGQFVFKVKGDGTVTSPAVVAEVQPVLQELAEQPHVSTVTSPYDPANARFISEDGKIAYAEIQFDVQSNDVPVNLATHMRDIVSKASSDTVEMELGGSMFTDQTQPASEAIGIVAAILILLLAFGSLLAMGLPIMTALFGIGCGLAVVTLLARVMDIPSFAPQVTAMIGIGVGIDYALFISTRYREALHEGVEPERAVVHAIDTSGRAVLFAGGTVVISLLGLFVIGVSFIRGLAIGASLAVLFVMAAAVTLLPAVLGFVGYTIDRWALPGAKKKRDVNKSFWTRWSRTIQNRPWPAALGGLLILLVLAVPFFSLRLGVADSGNDPTKFTTRRAYDLLSQGFGPGINGPLLVTGDATAADLATANRVRAAIAGRSRCRKREPGDPEPEGGVLIQVQSKGSPQDESTTELVHRLRDDVIPTATRGTDLKLYVGSQTAIGVDLADTLGRRLPIMFITILLLSFILLMVVFRSLLVPLKAVIMNLLSIGAAYGVIVAIFQWGWVKARSASARKARSRPGFR